MSNTEITELHPRIANIANVRVPVDMRARLSPPTFNKYPCGYCAVANVNGDHKACKRAIRAGDGHIMLCPCNDPDKHEIPDASKHVFCTQCYNEDIDELDEKLYLCWDREDCDNRVRSRLAKDPTIQLIHSAYLNADFAKRADNDRKKVQRTRNPSRPSSGKCLCCGEPTSGGMFLPGHDARLVSQTAKKVEAGADPHTTLSEFKALGVSDALYGKLERKLERM